MSVKPAYVSRLMAAEMLGVSEHGVDGLIQRGHLPVARPGVRARRSLLKSEVQTLARRRARLARKAVFDATAREERRAERADLPAGEWLSTVETARRLGVSAVWVRRLASQDRMPHIVRGDRYRFRADHVALVANAREAAGSLAG